MGGGLLVGEELGVQVGVVAAQSREEGAVGGVGSVAGVLVGALIGSLRLRQFRWESCDDPRELRRQIIGASIMGVGGVIAFGCSVGQGLSAFSALAWSAPVTLIAIFIGAAIGLRQLIEGLPWSRAG